MNWFLYDNGLRQERVNVIIGLFPISINFSKKIIPNHFWFNERTHSKGSSILTESYHLILPSCISYSTWCYQIVRFTKQLMIWNNSFQIFISTGRKKTWGLIHEASRCHEQVRESFQKMKAFIRNFKILSRSQWSITKICCYN